MADKRASFLSAYAKVPDNLRDDILVVIEKEPYTWTTAYIEIKENTALGKKILKALESMEVI